MALIATGAVVAGTAVAVPLLTLQDEEEKKPTSLVIPEGWRAAQVYEAVDKALELPAGTTRKSLAKANLKLPLDAEGNPEGYLFPATYPLAENSTPEALLSAMVENANKKFNGAPIAAGAQRNAMNVYQAVTIASIVQAEAATKEDMGKVARVIYNRLAKDMKLQMDSTVTYAEDLTGTTTSAKQRKSRSPYNTYRYKGLPPGPIAAPGRAALQAAAQPEKGKWLYFVTVNLDTGETKFASNNKEFKKLVAEFQAWCQANQGRCVS